VGKVLLSRVGILRILRPATQRTSQRIALCVSFAGRSVPKTWVTDYTGDIGRLNRCSQKTARSSERSRLARSLARCEIALLELLSDRPHLPNRLLRQDDRGQIGRQRMHNTSRDGNRSRSTADCHGAGCDRHSSFRPPRMAAAMSTTTASDSANSHR